MLPVLLSSLWLAFSAGCFPARLPAATAPVVPRNAALRCLGQTPTAGDTVPRSCSFPAAAPADPLLFSPVPHKQIGRTVQIRAFHAAPRHLYQPPVPLFPPLWRPTWLSPFWTLLGYYFPLLSSTAFNPCFPSRTNSLIFTCFFLYIIYFTHNFFLPFLSLLLTLSFPVQEREV